MSYYKRKRFYRNSTNVIRMKFQSFMDISTDVDSMKIITISAGGLNLLKRLPNQFNAYKYYKLGNVSVKLVPASTLPVDPTGLAYGVDQKVDPRDQLSPGLCRITNGEDIFEDISGLSDDQQRGIYNAMMLDPRWYKWMLQRGVKRHGTPRYWQVGQLHQDKWPGAVTNLPGVKVVGGDDVIDNTYRRFESVNPGVADRSAEVEGSSKYGLFQVGHKGVLGWMPTDGYQEILNSAGNGYDKFPLVTSPVEVEMFKIVLPKAFKTRFYYRVFISETVFFKEPIVMNAMEYRPLDVFHHAPKVVPTTPSTAVSPDTQYPEYDGGNYGDN